MSGARKKLNHLSAMKTPIIFIHGMFLNGKSWANWIRFFEQRGYPCSAPSWPFHEGEPSELRDGPPASLGGLSMEEVIRHYSAIIARMPDKPILIGHSLGGLIAQELMGRHRAAAAVAICSVAPNAMASCDWGFLRNVASIANPFAGDSLSRMTAEKFHAAFANTLEREESDRLFEQFAVHESRNVLRDAFGDDGQLDVELPHAPLLIVAAQEDEIVPDSLGRRNAEAYEDGQSVTAFLEFPKRGHLICGQPGWEEVASAIADWLHAYVPEKTAAA